MQLEKIDYEILEFVSEFKEVPPRLIFNHFKCYRTIEYRLKQLTEPDYYPHMFSPFSRIQPRPIPDSSYLADCENGNLYITQIGLLVLEDYKAIKREKLWSFFKYSILAPIIVAVITSYITTKFLQQ